MFRLEFKVEMLRKGKWITAHRPHNCAQTIFPTLEEANTHMEHIENSWVGYRERCKKFESEMGGNVAWDTFPEKFRIVSRKVTEWDERSENERLL